MIDCEATRATVSLPYVVKINIKSTHENRRTQKTKRRKTLRVTPWRAFHHPTQASQAYLERAETELQRARRIATVDTREQSVYEEHKNTRKCTERCVHTDRCFAESARGDGCKCEKRITVMAHIQREIADNLRTHDLHGKHYLPSEKHACNAQQNGYRPAT